MFVNSFVPMNFNVGRHRSEDDSIKIDFSKSSHEILMEILISINNPDLSNQIKLSYYNVFVKFISKDSFHLETSLSKKQILICLQVGLFSKTKELKAGALRAVRYFCSDLEVLQAFFHLHLQYFVVRSLDICLNNEVERTNALRLIRRIVSILHPVSPRFQPSSPASSLPPSSPPSSLSSPIAISSARNQQPVLTSSTRDSILKSDHLHFYSAASGFVGTPSPPLRHSCTPPHQAPFTQKSITTLLNGVVAVANDGFVLKDKLFNICLSTICELVIQDPFLASNVGGVSCLLRNIPQFHGHPRINEALVATILNLFNFPNTRSLIRLNLDLEQLLVPFTDLEFKVSLELKDRFDVGSDVKYGACKLALGTILRSWSGVFYMCSSSSSGLQSLLSMLSLSNMETRKEILDVFYDIFRISTPEWTDDFNTAMKSIATITKTTDTWKLVNGFIAEEAKSILPHLNSSRLNLIDNHVSFLLRCFVDLGIVEALTKAIISSNKHVCVRATVLLGELLHLISILLPKSYNRDSHCLPQLINSIMSSTLTNPSLRMQCSDALDCLLKIQNSKRIPPIESSNPFLQNQIISCFNAARIYRSSFSSEAGWGGVVFEEASHWSVESTYQTKKDSSAERDGNESLPRLLKDSQVLYTTDSKSWNWFDVLTILKFPEESLEIADEIMSQRFLERLMQVFRPSGRIYSMMKISDEKKQEMTLIAFHLVDYLLKSPEQAATSILFSFLQDVNAHLVKVIERSNVSESIMNPSSLINSCSQMYFLLIGRLSSNKKGNHLLGTSKIYDLFSLIASSSSSSDIIIKLIISSLDYSSSVEARKILKEALVSTSEESSHYCTSFMRILLRCKMPLFDGWCIPLLVVQMRSKSMAVAMEAMSVVMEAAEDEDHLRHIAGQCQNLRHLGFKSDALVARFLSLPDLFRQLSSDGTLEQEMNKWRTYNNLEFVDVVEERLVESLTTYERTYNYSYARRTSRKYARKDVLVPIHLYGQLVQHDDGVKHLREQVYLNDYFEVIRRAGSCTKESLKSTKAALWIMGHLGSTERGLDLLSEKNILPDIVRVAETNPILTLRGTAYYVLSMLSITRVGCDELNKHGWISVCVDKVDPYYVVPDDLKALQHQSSNFRKAEKVHSTIDFMSKISEVEPPFQDPSSPAMSYSTSGEGINFSCKERRQSVLTSIFKKFKSKPPKNPDSKVPKEFSVKIDKNTKKTKSKTPSISSEKSDNIGGDEATTAAPWGRRTSDILAEDPLAMKLPFGSVQSSCSSVGKMSTCSEDNNFSSSSVFLASDDRTVCKQEREEDTCDIKVEKVLSSTTVRTSSASSEDKNLPGFLSDPDILRPKTKAIQPFHWMTASDITERHKKTKSLDYRSVPKNSNIRHSLRDRFKMMRSTMKSYGDADLQSFRKHVTGASFRRPLEAPFMFSKEMRLQNIPIHFISISLPRKMDQVFQSLKPQMEDEAADRRNLSLSTRKEIFFKHPLPQDTISNRDSFNKLFDGLEEHGIESCFICSKKIQTSPSTSASLLADDPSICENNFEGKNMIRKEVLRLMLQLSCGIGNKATEQGLLILKQKFPQSFQSLCLYSDVSHMLSTCSFRLESRRFVQELFLDLKFNECQDEATQILNSTMTPGDNDDNTPSNNNIRRKSTSSTDDFKTSFSDFDFTFDRSVS